MTLKDFLERVNRNDLDKMMIFREGKGWSNIKIKVEENEISISCDRNRPFSSD
ncbi:hypothetical protein [Clostridium rectalis]|uniref:hypothetical protein n=1 Tax=Clostridium rectalis TaxID=2040295 RepID=UPI0013DE22D6|nr:hypothetical protein [Clostridium rectalis]